MNYDRARLKADGSGLWHFTTHNDRIGTRPVGYCADGCPGHATAEAAAEHYREYLLDNITFDEDRPAPRAMHLCEVVGCPHFTTGSAHLLGDVRRWWLCRDHRSKAEVARLCGPVSEVIHS